MLRILQKLNLHNNYFLIKFRNSSKCMIICNILFVISCHKTKPVHLLIVRFVIPLKAQILDNRGNWKMSSISVEACLISEEDDGDGVSLSIRVGEGSLHHHNLLVLAILALDYLQFSNLIADDIVLGFISERKM